MGREAMARGMRRETKRTLGRHLEDYARNQLQRLEALELELARTNDRLEVVTNSREYADSNLGDRLVRIERATLRQRVRWFLTGEWPAVTWTWKAPEKRQ